MWDCVCTFCGKVEPHWSKRQEHNIFVEIPFPGNVGTRLDCCAECLQAKIKQHKKLIYDTEVWWRYNIIGAMENVRKHKEYVRKVVARGEYNI